MAWDLIIDARMVPSYTFIQGNIEGVECNVLMFYIGLLALLLHNVSAILDGRWMAEGYR